MRFLMISFFVGPPVGGLFFISTDTVVMVQNRKAVNTVDRGCKATQQPNRRTSKEKLDMFVYQGLVERVERYESIRIQQSQM